MNYLDGINQMKSLMRNGSFSPYAGLKVDYPGYKGKGDYRLTKNGIAPTHTQIVEELYSLIRANTFTYDKLKDFLVDIYYNGTNTKYENIQLEELKNRIFWITLQEEINYPRTKGYKGINLPFSRYFEAIYASQRNATFTINEVLLRCNNYGGVVPKLYNIPNSPIFYK